MNGHTNTRSLRASTVGTPRSEAPRSDIPRHIAVVMDGNGRWAKRHGLPRVAGHRRGVEAVREIVRCCGVRDIPYLTLFAFSSENWRRPAAEVRLLIDLFKTTLINEVRKLDENGVRLKIIGDLTRFSPRIRDLVKRAEKQTAANTEQLVAGYSSNSLMH